MTPELTSAYQELALVGAGIFVIVFLISESPPLGGAVLAAVVLLMIFTAYKRGAIGG